VSRRYVFPCNCLVLSRHFIPPLIRTPMLISCATRAQYFQPRF
jgi:hypothetical protein